jgi:Protein of unknown function (DUF3015)
MKFGNSNLKNLHIRYLSQEETMKKLFGGMMAIALVCIHTSPALAGGYSHDPGCGLGSEIFKSGSKSIASQTLASTTNQFLSNQLFGLSTGSIGCTNSGQFASNEHATLFASLNFENLSQEMAQGGGEHLASLATVMGVPAEQQPAFFAMTQEKYATLVQAGETTPRAMLAALQEAMAAHPVLAQVR